ncbi:hypothetical protein QFA46_003015 [Acinetobacter baumannii]|nr:hypothetical protein [Acinetobacter baumannii]
MSSYSIQIGQVKGLYDVFLETCVPKISPQYPELQKIGDDFLNKVVMEDPDYHNSQVFTILSQVAVPEIQNRLKRLESKAKNKDFEKNYFDWNYIERGVVQERKDFINAIHLKQIYEKTKKLYEAQNGEELTSSIYADLLNANPQNLRRMLTHKREIDTRLLEEAKKCLEKLSTK